MRGSLGGLGLFASVFAVACVARSRAAPRPIDESGPSQNVSVNSENGDAGSLTHLALSSEAGAYSATGDAGAAGPVASDGIAKGAEEQLELVRSLPENVLRRITEGGRPDASGAVGHNRNGWMGAQYQRSVAGYFLLAASRGDRPAAEDAWRAVDFAFAHQVDDGGFAPRNESGSPSAPKDVYSDAAFWLAHLGQMLLVARASPLADGFRGRIELLLPKVRAAARLLAAGEDVLVAREASATNRYFIDALAYGLSGLLLRDHALEKLGAHFVDLSLERQKAEGFFEEAHGADSSYNCVSIWMLQVHDLYFPSPRYEAALSRALRWQLAHVLANGEIDVAGNTRTGLEQERYFGKAKGVNYPEAVLALLYYGARHRDGAALDAAHRVYAYKFGAR
jgi:hypothetical protein